MPSPRHQPRQTTCPQTKNPGSTAAGVESKAICGLLTEQTRHHHLHHTGSKSSAAIAEAILLVDGNRNRLKQHFGVQANQAIHMNTPNTQATLNGFATKLENLAKELANGQDFSVTKLTPIKRLCADHALAVRFASHFADIAYRKFLDHGIPEPATASQREKIGSAIEIGIKSLKIFNDGLSQAESANILSSAHSMLMKAQNDHKKGKWGLIREIYSMEALIIETAIECVLRPEEASSLCYQIARDHTERYDPRFGTGLIPSSADAVRDISRFFYAEAQRLSQ
jgi:hypothetical protein